MIRQKRYLRGFVLIQWRNIWWSPGLHLSYASPTGGLILKEDAGWRTWNGFLVALPRKAIWIYFRRRCTS